MSKRKITMVAEMQKMTDSTSFVIQEEATLICKNGRKFTFYIAEVFGDNIILSHKRQPEKAKAEEKLRVITKIVNNKI